MAKKLTLTRPELKRQRDALTRFERYLPMLKLKQQQLQLSIRDASQKRHEALDAAKKASEKVAPYRNVLLDMAGINVRQLAQPENVRVSTANIAGVNVPVFEGVDFSKATYSLFSTPAWVDRMLSDLREVSRHHAEAEVREEEYRLLKAELTKIIQRVNLFEKVKIPEAREIIRVIRIKLGDEMTAAVGRAKIAKTKLAASEAALQAQG
jgi:V/A-type H+-transporting ATPase subunit D